MSEKQTADSSGLAVVLGEIAGVRCSAAAPSDLWTMGVDVLVVSAGPEGYGRMGTTLSGQRPDLPWDDVVLKALTPESPATLVVPPAARRPDGSLAALLVATVHRTPRTPSAREAMAELDVTIRSIVRATLAAGYRRLGLPLIGTGALGISDGEVLRVLLPSLVGALQDAATTSREVKSSAAADAGLQEVVLIGGIPEQVNAIVTAWPMVEELLGASPSTPAPPQASSASASAPVVDVSVDPTLAPVLGGGISEDYVGLDRRIPADQDALSLSSYVGMLATVIARTDTPLPLSIGLFGEWGSGKSYFMGLLRDRVATLSATGGPEYCTSVVNIGFNAWSYADADLWASLGDEIFRQLGEHVDPPPSANETRRRLADELDDKLERARELAEARDRAKREVKRLQRELEQARSDRRTSLLDVAKAALELSGGEPGGQGRVDLTSTWRTLGIDDPAEQARILLETGRDTGRELSVLRRTAADPRARFGLAVGVVALLVSVAVAVWGEHLRAWVAGSGLLAALGGLGMATAVLRRTRDAVRTVTATAARVQAVTQDAKDRSLVDAVAAVRSAEADAKVAQAQLDQVLERAGELSRELVDLSPGQRLYGFLTERASSGDYRGRLGLIATIRRDFEHLIALMADLRAERDDPRRAPDPTRPQAVDRIVLYIDDLDRCSPAQVVQVLQAVHLLLALDLFVVVVGVDPRWLLHSLRHQYRDVLTADGAEASTGAAGGVGAAGGSGSAGGSSSADRGWLSTPSDYLEKIFNIPFVLPGLSASGVSSLFERLATPSGGPSQDALSASSGLGDGERGVPDAAGQHAPAPDDDPSLMHAEAGSEIAAQEEASSTDTAGVPVQRRVPPTRPITQPELTLLGTLAPLLDSPRAAKRLLNLYRMLRSTRDLGDASTFLGTDEDPGEYQAVIVLLGLLSAYPRLLGELLYAPADAETGVLGGLCGPRPVDIPWSAVLAGLEPRRDEAHDGPWHNDVHAALDDAARQEWARLVRDARPVTEAVRLPDATAVRTWGPRVSRFSFLLATLDTTPSG